MGKGNCEVLELAYFCTKVVGFVVVRLGRLWHRFEAVVGSITVAGGGSGDLFKESLGLLSSRVSGWLLFSWMAFFRAC